MIFTKKLKKIIDDLNKLGNILNISNNNFNFILISYFKKIIIEQLLKDNVKRKFTIIILRIFDHDKYIIYLLLKNNINPINWFLIQDKDIFQERNLITNHEQIMKLCKIQIHPVF